MSTIVFSGKTSMTANVLGHIICFRDDYVGNTNDLLRQATTILRQMKPRTSAIPKINSVYVNTVKAVAISTINAEYISRLLTHADVKSVEADIEVSMFTVPRYTLNSNDMTYSGSMWGSKKNKIRGDLPKSNDLSNINIFVLDTGVSITPFINVDVNLSESFVPYEKNFTDLNGHGTAIAHTIASMKNDNYGNSIGICPRAKIISCKCLDKNGKGQLSWVISAIEKIYNWKHLNPSALAVVNISLGGYTGSFEDTALDTAINNLITVKNVPVVVAAGNSGNLASLYTPCHLKNCITVGSYDDNNTITKWSNYGLAVNVLAPGTDILSMTINDALQTNTYKTKKAGINLNDGIFNIFNGTSFSAAYVTGVIGLYLDIFKAIPNKITYNAILSAITPDGTGGYIDGILTNNFVALGYNNVNINTNNLLEYTINKTIFALDTDLLFYLSQNMYENIMPVSQNALNAKNTALNAKTAAENAYGKTLNQLISDNDYEDAVYELGFNITTNTFNATNACVNATKHIINLRTILYDISVDAVSILNSTNPTDTFIYGNAEYLVDNTSIYTYMIDNEPYIDNAIAYTRIAIHQTMVVCEEYINTWVSYINWMITNNNIDMMVINQGIVYINMNIELLQTIMQDSNFVTEEAMNKYTNIINIRDNITQQVSGL